MLKNLQQYIDIKFYMLFASLFLVMYWFYTIVIGITVPGGTYFSFVDNYLNFPIWIRTSVLHGAQLITDAFGLNSLVTSDSLTNLENTKVVRMGWPCYGLMIKSFWLSYVLAHPDSWSRKLKWALGGIFLIWIINCWRIAILFLSMEKKWTFGESLNSNNHDLFNYFSYVVIIILILRYNKNQNVFIKEKYSPAKN